MEESCSYVNSSLNTNAYRPQYHLKSNHTQLQIEQQQVPTSTVTNTLSLSIWNNGSGLRNIGLQPRTHRKTKPPPRTTTAQSTSNGTNSSSSSISNSSSGSCNTTTSIALTFFVNLLLLTDLTTTTAAAKLKAFIATPTTITIPTTTAIHTTPPSSPPPPSSLVTITTPKPPLEFDISNGLFFEYYRQQNLEYELHEPHHHHRQRDIQDEGSKTATSSTSAAPKTHTTPPITSSPTNSTPGHSKCEPKTLDEIPPDPFYDVTDIVEDAIREFGEFLSAKYSLSMGEFSVTDQFRDEVRRRANAIAGDALSQDENLLAFAIAAPSIHAVVVKFRDNVTIPQQEIHNKSFLGNYWRELGLAWNSTDGAQEWSAPFKDCSLLQGRWLWPFRISSTEFRIKIVAAAFIAADVDLCNDALEEIFGRRHGCDRNTTFCLLTETKLSTTRDGYTCICKDSYYLPNSTLQGFPAEKVENSDYDNFSCIPCPGGCSSCDQNGICLFGEPQEAVTMENLFRVSVGSILGACILFCLVLVIIVFRHRKCKAIASGMWTVLETILLGIIFLYASVGLHFLPASTERCLLEPWFRELGFITCYGAIILKLYRHLVDFRTRKAHRWVLRDVDLLKYLATMVFAVTCYMAAFTASSLDLIETAQLDGLRETQTNTCHPLKWEYVTQISEILILCFGLNLAVASRNAITQFRERQFLVASLLIEFIVSSSFYIARFIYLPEMSPGAVLLALFLRSQLTNTITLGLVFVPKIWYKHKQVRSLAHDLSLRLPVDAFKGSHDTGHHLGGGYAGLCLGDPDIGELTISEMSPEDIRAELKRLYTQLEILKNKTLRQDNPHISKRRGGRKAGHRRFSLQALSSKHRSNKHHQDIEITEAEPSRTPEDSICSAEGPTDTYAEISGISHSMISHAMVSHNK